MMFLCESITPFGLPVVPEVYIMVAVSSSFTRSRRSSTSYWLELSSPRLRISDQLAAPFTSSKVKIPTNEGTCSFTRNNFSYKSLSETKQYFSSALLKIYT